jgi:hypothetical protein
MAPTRIASPAKTHMPTPTKVLWYNNANFLNQSKWVYNLIVNVLPKMDMIVDQQIEWTGSAEYSDVVLPVNSWVEIEDYECGGSCSNPFLQVWKGGIKPVHDTIDDGLVFAKCRSTPWTATRRRPAVCRLLQVRHGGQEQGLYPTSLRQLRPRPAGKTDPTTSIVCSRVNMAASLARRLMLFRTYPASTLSGSKCTTRFPSTPIAAGCQLLRSA